MSSETHYCIVLYFRGLALCKHFVGIFFSDLGLSLSTMKLPKNCRLNFHGPGQIREVCENFAPQKYSTIRYLLIIIFEVCSDRQ